jgi:hypothetical protein
MRQCEMLLSGEGLCSACFLFAWFVCACVSMLHAYVRPSGRVKVVLHTPACVSVPCVMHASCMHAVSGAQALQARTRGSQGLGPSVQAEHHHAKHGKRQTERALGGMAIIESQCVLELPRCMTNDVVVFRTAAPT